MRLKKSYSSREVAALTGLTARQLQGWDAGRLVRPSIAPRRTEAGGFTERRYSPIELFELAVLADLRRRGFTVERLRRLVENLRARFGVRLFDAIEGGPLELLTDGQDVYVRTRSGGLSSLVRAPDQPLLTLDGEEQLKPLSVRFRSRRRHGPVRSRDDDRVPGADRPRPARRRRTMSEPPGPPGDGPGDRPAADASDALEAPPAEAGASRRGSRCGSQSGATGRTVL